MIWASLVLSAALAIPSSAAATPTDFLTASQSVLSGTTISIKESDGRTEILDRVVIRGAVPIPGQHQSVALSVRREGREIISRQVPTDPVSGRYRTRLRLSGCCDYTVQAGQGSDISDPLSFEVQGPATLEPGRRTLLFNRLLQERGFHVGTVSDQFHEGTGLAIMALRKTNEMPMSEEYAPSLFELLLRGRGGFEPVHDEDGRHVEVDVSRQVMALVEDGEATDVFHVSTGAGGTPRGEWSFYQKGPGYNAKGMYYSIYYDGNYATHGYSSVPTYPASHGCTRNPIPFAVFIYNWISLGDTMYVYD